MRFRQRATVSPALRAGLMLPLAALLLPLAFPAPPLGAQGRNQKAVPELDFDKLFKVEAPSFQRLATRLNGLARPRTSGRTFSWARFELFEPVPVRLPPDQYTGSSNNFKVYLKQRGKALVLGQGRLWAPRQGDSQENFKNLTVSVSPGQPRILAYSFRVHATVENGTGPNPPVTILGREGIELQLIQHPEDKSLRLVLDPVTFLKHQESVSSNWVEEAEGGSKEESKNEEKEKTEKEPKKAPEEEKKEAPRPNENARSEITLVRSFKADERAIVIGFRRKWPGLGDKVVDGTLHIEMNHSLNTSLYYELPGEEGGKTRRVRAAYFMGGHKAQ